MILSNLPPAAKYQRKSGDQVFSFSEIQKRWISRIPIVEVDGGNIWINDEKRIYKMNISQVASHYSENDYNDDITLPIRFLKTSRIERIPCVCITDSLISNDLRTWSLTFYIKKEKQFKVLMDRNAFKVVLEKYLFVEANVFRGRFFLVIKM